MFHHPQTGLATDWGGSPRRPTWHGLATSPMKPTHVDRDKFSSSSLGSRHPEFVHLWQSLGPSCALHVPPAILASAVVCEPLLHPSVRVFAQHLRAAHGTDGERHRLSQVNERQAEPRGHWGRQQRAAAQRPGSEDTASAFCWGFLLVRAAGPTDPQTQEEGALCWPRPGGQLFPGPSLRLTQGWPERDEASRGDGLLPGGLRCHHFPLSLPSERRQQAVSSWTQKPRGRFRF